MVDQRGAGGGPALTPVTLKPDAIAQLAALKATVGSNLDKVGAIYLLDEPYGVGRDVSYDDLNTAVSQVRAAFPGKIVMMTLDGPSVVNSRRRIPAGIDWVGFDWYCHGHAALASTLTTLESRLESPYQRTYLMPESASLTCQGTTDGGIAAAQQTYVDIAAADPRVTCLLNFVWWFSASYGGDMDPLVDLPLTAQTQRTPGERIVGPRRRPGRDRQRVPVQIRRLQPPVRGPDGHPDRGRRHATARPALTAASAGTPGSIRCRPTGRSRPPAAPAPDARARARAEG